VPNPRPLCLQASPIGIGITAAFCLPPTGPISGQVRLCRKEEGRSRRCIGRSDPADNTTAASAGMGIRQSSIVNRNCFSTAASAAVSSRSSPSRLRAADGHGVKATAQPFNDGILNPVDLVHHGQSGNGPEGQIHQDPADRFHFSLQIGIRGVDNVEQQVGFRQFFQRGPERGHEVRGQIPDEADRVGDNDVALARESEPARSGIRA